MSLDLSAFALTAGTKAPIDPALDAEKAVVALHNDLLAMHWASVAAERSARKAAGIAAKLDNPDIAGTPEQRGLAEAKHFGLMQSAKRERADVVKHGRAVTRRWPQIPESERAWIVTELACTWSDSPLWRFVQTDPVLGRDAVWAQLFTAAQNAPSGEPCPF